jgi:hypothetical protein
MEHSGANIEQLIKEAKHKFTSEKFGLNETAEQTEPVRSILELQKATGWTLFDIKERYIAKQIKIIRYDIRTNLKTGELILFGGHVTESEYDRCTDFARSQQGKPTYEQLETEIIELKAENGRLKNQSSQQENHKTQNPPCMSRIVEIIELFENSNTFIKYGIGTQQGLIEDWLEDKTETRDEKTVIKKLITEHYKITTGRAK